jgi:hypothetical protein
MLLLGLDTSRLELTFVCTATSVRSLSNVQHFVVMRLIENSGIQTVNMTIDGGSIG